MNCKHCYGSKALKTTQQKTTQELKVDLIAAYAQAVT